MAQELIIGLVNHRKMGRLFQAFLIEPNDTYYTVIKLVRERDVASLSLSEHEKQLVALTETISDEELTKRFSKRMEPTNFINNITPSFFKEQMNPYIDEQLMAIIHLLMQGNTRLFNKGDKYSNLYDEDLIKVHKQFIDCRLLFERATDGIHYRLQLYHEGKYFPLLYKKFQFLVMKPAAFIYKEELYVLEKLESTKMLPFFSKKEVHIPPSSEQKYFETFIKQTIAEYKVKAQGFKLYNNNAEPVAKLNVEEDLYGKLAFIPRFEYGKEVFLSNDLQKINVELKHQDDEYIFTRTRRDLVWEKECLKQYATWGLIENHGSYYPSGANLLTDADANLALFDWVDKHEHLFSEHKVRCSQSAEAQQYSRLKGELEFEVNDGDDWFDVHAKVRFGSYEVPFIKLKDHIRQGIQQFELPNGEIAILPSEWFTTYADLLELGEELPHALRIKKHHYSLLKQTQVGIDKHVLARLQQLEDSGELVAQPKQLQATLRSYQHRGFSWLYHLYAKQFGACLADDMGLGKTLQTITLLLKLKRNKQPATLAEPMPVLSNEPRLFQEIEAVNAMNKQSQPASLIVMPTSLLHNWREELRKFAPQLKVYTHYGSQRKKNSNFQQLSNLYDVILTTYGTVRNDVEQMKDFSFFYLILDESQYIKNPESKIYQSIWKLKSKHKLVLTGTPIENSLSDLWAQMNFINPGLLGNYNYFKREFITPIEKKQNEEQQDKLKILIRPFILRRTKQEVAPDLPALTEQVRYCKMAKTQHSIYEREKSAIRNDLIRKIEEEGVQKNTMRILQGLSRLRQLANHPDMVDVESDGESGKFKAITETLSELIKEKHKVLIFSSFVKHLKLVQRYLDDNKLPYAMLTGSTANREEVIQSFQDCEENRVFLISLKAGGVGLNLTQADYVFILDPWWNPAAEMQAISRAHRIGQENKVMVYRFITEGSIEEKIIGMQERKSDLADKFVNNNNPFKTISKQEIIQLFG